MQPAFTFTADRPDFDPFKILMEGGRTTPQAPRKPLHYYRCNTCLKPLTATEQHPAITCHICEGKAHYLGRAGDGNHLLQDIEKCPCDARCTNATGPNCDCKCGGINHGTGLIVELTIVVGTIPKATGKSDYKHKAMADDWKKALVKFDAACQAKHGPDYYVDWQNARMTQRQYWRLHHAFKMRSEARELKSQLHRLNKITAAIVYIQKAD